MTFKVGDEVLLINGYHRRSEPSPVTITKVGRKYVSVDGAPRARFDRETGHSEHGSRIVTREQHAVEVAERDAEHALREWGIDLRWDRPASARAVAILEALKPIMGAS